MGKSRGKLDTYCHYCDASVVRVEEDHFPIPREAGGTRTVSACGNCHDLKDRQTLDQFPEGSLRAVAAELQGPEVAHRLVFMSMLFVAARTVPDDLDVTVQAVEKEWHLLSRETRIVAGKVFAALYLMGARPELFQAGATAL
jgi:hypothetical protein